jgi:hypothetical protein
VTHSTITSLRLAKYKIHFYTRFKIGQRHSRRHYKRYDHMHLKESMKDREKLGESMKLPWERRTKLGFGENQGKGR